MSTAKIVGAGMVFLLKLLVSGFVLSTPVLGIWIGSSLAAYRGGALWIPIAAGLAAFPVLPLAWEAFAKWRRSRQASPRDHILTFWDRLLLRTFAVNFVFLAILLWSRPETAFEALNARGDWMLGGNQGPAATKIRRTLFAAAGKLEWLYEWAHADEFEKLAPENANVAQGDVKAGSVERAPEPEEPAPDPQQPKPRTKREPESKPIENARRWPAPSTLHPAVTALSAEDEASIDALGKALAARESDPFRRAKAVHDWIADRVAYDAPAYADKVYPPQDAKSVFSRKTAVCAGYSQLFVALARAADQKAVYVTGDARISDEEIDGASHAWNAIELEGAWYLLDVTWNAGFVNGREFTKTYRTEYFLTPPEVFGIDHHPDVERWQLRESPQSRGDFLRQPMLRPAFFARGLKLRRPDRSQVSVDSALEVEIENPTGQYLLASLGPKGSSADERCVVSRGATLTAHCALPSRGVFIVQLFANHEPYGSFESIGSLQAVRR